MSEVVSERLARLESQYEHLATKEDLANLNERLARLESQYKHLATKEDLADIKTNLADIKTNLIKWLTAILFVGLSAIAAILRYLTPS